MKMSERIAQAIIGSGRQPRDLSKEIGISVARISQLKSESGGIKAEHLFAFARATGYSPQWIAEGVGEPRTHAPQENDYAVIAQHNAKKSDGTAPLNAHAGISGELVFKRSWLNSMGLQEKSLKVIYTQGNSMSPTLADGDALLLDESQKEASNRHVYAILRPDGELIIKRLVRTMTNGWIIRSDNEDKRLYPDEIASDTEIGNLKIEGRIVWHGGAL